MENDSAALTLAVDLVENAAKEYACNTVFYSAVAVLVYDNLLSFEEETTYIWSSKWTPIKLIFLIVRYLSLGIQLFSTVAANSSSILVCEATKWVSGFGGGVLQAAADIFLVYRVYAFCGRSRRLLIFLIGYLVFSETAAFSVRAIYLSRVGDASNPVPALDPIFGKCVVIHDPSEITAIWLIMLAFQSVLFLCLLIEATSTIQRVSGTGIRHAPLYIVFIRDGLWVYFLIVVSLLLCVVSFYKVPEYGSAFIAWLFSLTSICCCRLILNLRSAFRNNGDSDENGSSMILTDLSSPK